MIRHLPEILLIQGTLYIIYLLVFRRSKELKLNRLLLPAILILPLVLPLLPKWGTERVGFTYQLPEIVLNNAELARGDSQFQDVSWVAWIWAFGAFLLVGFRAFQGIRIWNWSRMAKQTTFNGIQVLSSARIPVPFSFGKRVFLPADLSEENRHWILLHESQHVKQKHYLDLWMSNALCCVFWFNPFVWLLQKEIKLNHEYLSDASCSAVNEKESYSFALLAHALDTEVSNLTHAFSLSGQLKNRIDMLHKNQSAKRRWSYLAWVPIMGLAIVFTACERPSETETVEKEVTVSSDEELKNLPKDEKTPEFPGGMEAMMKYFQDNVKYPKEMEKNGTEAKVLVGFKVDKEGKISDVAAQKADEIDDAFVKEAERVVADMPKWNPGNNARGEEVIVELVIPIVFKLSKEKSFNGWIQLNRLAELKKLRGLNELASLNKL